jgi:enhancer of mRNA-decapping protein 3
MVPFSIYYKLLATLKLSSEANKDILIVYLPQNGNWITEITINASDISDLKEATDEKVPPFQSQSIAPQFVTAFPPVSNPQKFEDPAILSMGRRPSFQVPTPAPIELPTVVTDSRRHSAVSDRILERDITPAAVLVDPMIGLGLANGEVEDAGIGSEADPSTVHVKRTRRRRARKGPKQASDIYDGDESLPKTTPLAETKRGRGWRQTPLLEPNPSFQPFATLKKRGKKSEYDNGWATEDATDVQDMGEFDFETELAKFDKKTVFDGIKKQDVISDGDRLVGHNRLPKPGTAGGKNLAPSENVLDLLKKQTTWKSEDDSDPENDVISHRDTGSGRNSRRADSRLRRPLSRKDSSVNPPTSRGPASAQHTGTSKSAFYLVPANKRCEVISSLQMLNLENIANSELGLTEDMMTENAARGIAEVALSALIGGTRLTQGTTKSLPYVIVYAGNNKSGLRAVAAGRHLRNHGANVVVCVLGLEREPELLEGLRKQLKVFRSFGGKVVSKTELIELVKGVDVPVELIIDGLLGLTISFEELRTGDQAAAYELIEWANRSKSSVLAVDIPTGLDPSSGKVSIIDGSPLYIHAKYVVAMGAPKKGLLEAMTIGDGLPESQEWQLFVADIGIANQAWKKAGTRVRRGVEFEGTWVVGIRFQKGMD